MMTQVPNGPFPSTLHRCKALLSAVLSKTLLLLLLYMEDVSGHLLLSLQTPLLGSVAQFAARD